MQRLKAIRDRMSAQNELAADAGESASPPDRALPAAEDRAAATLSAQDAPETAGMTRGVDPVAAGTSSMWDMFSDDDLLTDLDTPLPALDDEPPEPAPDIPRGFRGFPAAVPTPPQAAPSSFGAGPASAMLRPAADAPPEAVRRTGRVKTRLLGFEHSSGHTTDCFEHGAPAGAVQGVRFPVGWLVVVDGPGRGASIALRPGISQIGRDEGQAVQLDFGDTSISRTNHAAIAYDAEARSFFVGHGGKSNLVRLNGRPLLSTEPMKNGDTLLIGETRLRLVALCDEHFSWGDQSETPGT